MEKYTVILVVVGAVSSVLFRFISDLAKNRKTSAEAGQTIEERITTLAGSLKEATSLIGSIETEINKRSALVDKLQKDAKTYEEIVKISQAGADAVAQLLRGEIQKEGKTSFWKGVILNFVFFILGAGASWGINILTLK